MSSKSVSNKSPSLIRGLIVQAENRLPQFKPQIELIAPYVEKAADAIDAVFPYAVAAYGTATHYWELAQPYKPQRFLPLILGVVMCFFGGSYLMLIAAVEAVRLSVWQKLWVSVQLLWKNYKIAEAASRKDDEADADGNGVADVKEISDQQLLTRKLFLFARTVNPEEVQSAISMLWAGFISVVATLRVRFAQAITLGSSLGEMAQSHFGDKTLPMVEKAIPTELQKWTKVVHGAIYSVFGVIFAWFFHRIIAGFHCAVRGANLFVTNAIILAKEHGFLEKDFSENSPRASAVAGLVAAMGFYWQLSNGFSVPFPLNVLLFPVSNK